MKLSAKLLIAVFLFFLIGLFASNKLLKEQYDKHNDKNQTAAKNNAYWNYTKLTDKPFKHVKIENGNILGEIVLEQSPFFAVYYNEKPNYAPNNEIKGEVTGVVIDDTLFVNIPAKATDSWSSNNNIIHVFAPYFESITCKDSRLELTHLNQKELNVHLLGHSGLGVSRDTVNTDVLNVTIEGFSKFIWLNENIFQKVNAKLSKGGELDLGRVEVKSLNFNASESASIKLSSNTLKALMK